MKPTSVEKIKEFGDCTIYRTSCDCMSDDHSLTIFVEKDEISSELSLIFYVNCSLDEYFIADRTPYLQKLYKSIKKRIKYAWKILFHGYVELEHEFLFSGDQHAQDLLDAIEDGKERLIKLNKEKETNND